MTEKNIEDRFIEIYKKLKEGIVPPPTYGLGEDAYIKMVVDHRLTIVKTALKLLQMEIKEHHYVYKVTY